MNGGFIWHSITHLIKEGRQEEDHAVLVLQRRAKCGSQGHGVAMDRNGHAVGSQGTIELGCADSIQSPECLVTNRGAFDSQFDGSRGRTA
jgi:hypothetical protein